MVNTTTERFLAQIELTQQSVLLLMDSLALAGKVGQVCHRLDNLVAAAAA